MTNTIRRELLIPRPPEQVWHALADREALAAWMYPNNFEPIVGHRFTFQIPPNPKANFGGMTVHCEVIECEPPSRLVFSWAGGGLTDTLVSFQLKPEGESTRVLFEHAGFDVSIPRGNQAFRGAEFGWSKMIGQLAAVVTDLTNKRKQ